MKKLLFALFIPMMGTAQTVQDTTVVKAPLSVIKTPGKKDTLLVVPPPGKAIYDNTYTLTEADNGGVLYVYVTCTISCPLLFKDFSCKIIRMGTSSSATVTITGAKSVYGYRRLLIPYADAAINYVTNSLPILTGRISK